MNKEDLYILRRSAAELLAAAVFEYFPRSRVLSGGSTDTGFYYDFIFNEQLELSHLSAIEEKMRLLASEDIEIKMLRMMPKNAVEYLFHLKLKNDYIFQKIEDVQSDLVVFVQINNYINILDDDNELLSSSRGIKNFRLSHFERIDDGTQDRIRIFGSLFEDFSELKDYLKLQKRYLEENHLTYGEEANLFFSLNGKYSSSFIWNKRGVLFKKSIESFLKRELDRENFIEIQTPDFVGLEEENGIFFDEKDLKKIKMCLSRLIEKRGLGLKIPFSVYEEKKLYPEVKDLFSGLFRSGEKHIFNEYIVCREADLLEKVISSLKFILKILKIYGFNDYSVICKNFAEKAGCRRKKNDSCSDVLKSAMETCGITYKDIGNDDRGKKGNIGASLEFFIEDGQKWLHRGPNLAVEFFSKKEDTERAFLIKRSSLGALEDLIALFLEKENGEIPFWINPEQVRIISLDNSLEYAEHIKDVCERNRIRAFIDVEDGPLNKRVHLAMKEKVSFIAVVGEKERKTQNLSYRQLGESQMGQMSIDSFIKKLQDIDKRLVQEY